MISKRLHLTHANTLDWFTGTLLSANGNTRAGEAIAFSLLPSRSMHVRSSQLKLMLKLKQKKPTDDNNPAAGYAQSVRHGDVCSDRPQCSSALARPIGRREREIQD
jgi:hypothetical protein